MWAILLKHPAFVFGWNLRWHWFAFTLEWAGLLACEVTIHSFGVSCAIVVVVAVVLSQIAELSVVCLSSLDLPRTVC